MPAVALLLELLKEPLSISCSHRPQQAIVGPSQLSPPNRIEAVRVAESRPHVREVRSSHDQDSEREAAEFLLLDRPFPRSIVHTLDTAVDALERLEPPDRRGGLESEATRLLGRARAELEYRTTGDSLIDLPARMADLQLTCGRANLALSRRFFEGAVAAEWHGGLR